MIKQKKSQESEETANPMESLQKNDGVRLFCAFQWDNLGKFGTIGNGDFTCPLLLSLSLRLPAPSNFWMAY